MNSKPPTNETRTDAPSGAPPCSESSIENPPAYTALWYADRIIELERERDALRDSLTLMTTLAARHVPCKPGCKCTLQVWISQARSVLEKWPVSTVCKKCGGDGYVVKIVSGAESQAGVAEDCSCVSSQNA